MLDYDNRLVAHETCPPATRPQPVCPICFLVHAGECF